MATNIFIPKLGMTMEKATIAEWCVSDGDQVEAGDVVLVIDTEKAANDIEAPAAGKIAIFGEVGAEYLCGEVIAVVAGSDEEYQAAKQGAPAPEAVGFEAVDVQPAEETVAVVEPQQEPSQGQRKFISPVAKKLALQNSIEYMQLSGSGPNGRIVKKDILAVIEKRKTGAATSVPTVVPTQVQSAIFGERRVKEVIPLKGMRKMISEHMLKSNNEAARVSFMTEIDMTEMRRIRNCCAEAAQSIGVKVTYTDFFIMAIAKALQAAPIMNSSLVGDEIRVWEDINVGFAVAMTLDDGQAGLVVPVIRNVEKMSLSDISKARTELTEKSRDGQLSLDEMSGGTITLTNTGALLPTWHVQTPVINLPESAIIGTSSIVDKAVVVDGEIVIRPIMPISLSFDHRVMNGAQPAQFVNRFNDLLTNPELIII